MDATERILLEMKEQMAKQSQLKLYSFGIVLENKPRSINDLLVCPVEILPLLSGELGSEIESLEHKGVDFYGEEYTVKVNARQGIRCKWLSLGSNRVTAPDVRVNERVLIYRFADSDEYYWKETGLDEHLRRLETVSWLFSADPNGLADTPRSAENSYVFEVSTHDKLITLRTTTLNEEPFAYTFQINTNEGRVTLTDDSGNFFELDSALTCITLQNKEGTKVELNKESINVYAPENISVIAEKKIDIECENLTATVGKDVVVSASTVLVDSPMSTFTGQVSAGAITVAPGSSGGDGGLSVSGDSTVEGNMVVSGNITCKKLTSTEPISAPNV